MLERDYWMQLFGNLLNECPVDTHNMQTHITLFETPTDYVIVVAAPFATNEHYKKKGITKRTYTDKKTNKPVTVHNYAGAVNEADKSPHKGWIEKQIEHTQNEMRERYNYLGG